MNPIVYQVDDIPQKKWEKEVNQRISNIVLRYNFSLMQTINQGKKNQYQEKKNTQGTVNIF